MKGKFIVVEGGDGAGKDTQIDLIKEAYGEEKITYVKDPGSTEIGLKLREIVQHNERLSKRAETFLFFAARAQLADEIIVPALEGGKHVISNRYDLSTLAYQIHGRGRLAMEEIMVAMSDHARVIEPDLYIFLNVPPEVGLLRLEKRDEEKTRFEKEQVTFHERVHQGYLKHLETRKHAMIDACKPINEVFTEVKKVLDDII